MTSWPDPFAGLVLSRRGLLLGAAASAALLPWAAVAQDTTAKPQPDSAEADRIAAEFAGGTAPVASGIELDLPVLGDNPAAVPLRAKVIEAISEAVWCEEMIVIAELNPQPLACRFSFTPQIGSAEIGIRLRLIQTMPVRVMARMSDGRILMARQEITVTAGGCGM